MTRKITKRDNFYWLLIALVLLLMSGSVFSQLQMPYGAMLVGLSLLLVLFVSVWSLDREQPKWRRTRLGIALLTVALVIADKIFETPAFALGELLGYFVFLSLSLYLVSRAGAVHRGCRCQQDRWRYLYLYPVGFPVGIFLHVMRAHLSGFVQRTGQRGCGRENLEQFLYYSMVTLTTVGYGDITPEQPVAQFLAYMEGITGIFYTTILVASLIGVRLASMTASGNREQNNDNEK